MKDEQVFVAIIYIFEYYNGMVFEELLAIVGQSPLFDTGLLLAGDVNPDYLRRQLSDWVKRGRLWQLRRGLYALAPPYQKTTLHPFLAANRMVAGSYVSVQAALGYYGLIPEHVTAVTSVTTRRPGEWNNPVGQFIYRHIQPKLFFGYERREVSAAQFAYVASPEKALLDLIYLQPEGESSLFLESLRLQNLDQFDVAKFKKFVERAHKPKLFRAVDAVSRIVATELEAYESL
jgi:predicted transcriptional regulator of viral defense system